MVCSSKYKTHVAVAFDRNAALVLTMAHLMHFFALLCKPNGKPDFIGKLCYNINIMRQSACLVFNPITVNNFAPLFNCMPVGRASDSVMAPT